MKPEVTNKPKILVVLGPTSTGKSSLAVELALAHKGEVVSADSRQVYKGMDIGTGKITQREMQGIPHHMVDVVSAKKVFSVDEWRKGAIVCIEDILARGKLPIICGGTGFYIQSIVDNLVLPEVPPNAELRKKLEKKTAEQLLVMLQKKDPERAKTIEKNNPVRLIRAIEIALALGKVPCLDKQTSRKENRYDMLQIGLILPTDELWTRIYMRLIVRIKKGMIEEAKKLHTNGISWKRMHALGLEYRFLAEFLQNKISRKELVEKIEKGNLDYAKRQVTWFKRDTEIKWFRPEETDKIEKVVKKFLQNKK